MGYGGWYCVWFVLTILAPLCARADTDLPDAIKKLLWSGPQPVFEKSQVLLTRMETKTGAIYRSDPPVQLTLRNSGTDEQRLCLNHLCVDSTRSEFGRLPPLAAVGGLDLLWIQVGGRSYRVVVHTGDGIFANGTWQRYAFLHVFTAGAGDKRPMHYALVADGYLYDGVLGVLPGSTVLNYARLVPTDWLERGEAGRYEVLLYAMDGKGLERVRKVDGKPLAYILERTSLDAPWMVSPTDETPKAVSIDQGIAEALPFSSNQSGATTR